jgi:predicted MFS family arabinose efflux permease
LNPAALLVVLGISGFAANIAIRIVDPMVPLVARSLNVTVGAAAMLATAYTLPYALVQPILGPLGDSKGKARVMTWCLFALAASLLACMFAPNYETLVFFRVLSGAAAGGAIPLSIAMIGDRFPVEQRQLALSRYLVVVIIGQVTGAPLAGLLSDAYGWRPVFGVAAVVAALAAIAVKTGIAPRKIERPPLSLSGSLATYRAIIAHPVARMCYLGVFVEGIAIYGGLPYVAALLEGRNAGSVREAGFVVAGIGIGGLIFAFCAKSLLSRVPRSTVMLAGGWVIAAGLIAVGISPTWPLEMAAFTAAGLGFYMLHTGLQTEVTEVMPTARGSAVALHAFSLFAGMAAGPVVWGPALTILGAPVAYSIAAALMLMTTIMAVRQLHRPR